MFFIDQVRFVRADKAVGVQQLFVFLQGPGGKQVLAVGEEKLRVIALAFQPDDASGLNTGPAGRGSALP
jgi:hypothetical protein